FKACGSDASQPYPEKSLPIEPILEILNNGNLTKEQEEHIDNIWNYKTGSETICEDFSIIISGHDIKTIKLDSENIGWLNDNIIDFYLQLIVNKTPNKKIFAYPSYFHRTLTDRYQDAIRFRKRQSDLHQFDLYLLPILLNDHWTILYYQPDLTKIGFYNSLISQGPDPKPILERTTKYFKHLFETRGRNWTNPNIDDTIVPQQKNGSDCCVYVRYFARCLAIDKTIDVLPEQIGLFRKQLAYEIATKELINKLF
ncbi:hypothetical protein B4U79_17112, partial [Dinothrombium tinctorium]